MGKRVPAHVCVSVCVCTRARACVCACVCVCVCVCADKGELGKKRFPGCNDSVFLFAELWGVLLLFEAPGGRTTGWRTLLLSVCLSVSVRMRVRVRVCVCERVSVCLARWLSGFVWCGCVVWF